MDRCSQRVNYEHWKSAFIIGWVLQRWHNDIRRTEPLCTIEHPVPHFCFTWSPSHFHHPAPILISSHRRHLEINALSTIPRFVLSPELNHQSSLNFLWNLTKTQTSSPATTKSYPFHDTASQQEYTHTLSLYLLYTSWWWWLIMMAELATRNSQLANSPTRQLVIDNSPTRQLANSQLATRQLANS